MVIAVAVLAPIATTIWFTLLGGSGIYYQLTGAVELVEALEGFSFDVATLTIAQALPGGAWMAGVLLYLGEGRIGVLQQFIVITAIPVSVIILPTLWTGPQAAMSMAREQKLL